MGLFRKNKKGPTQSNQIKKTPHQLDDLTTDALDSIAIIFRAMASYAFQLSGDNLERFQDDCKAWARHVLTGIPIEDLKSEIEEDEKSSPPSASGLRSWAELRHFYRNRRRDEQRFVLERLGELKDVIWDLVDGLHVIASGERSTEGTIQSSIGTLEKAVEGSSLEDLRAAVNNTTQVIREALTQQREQFDNQIQQMGRRLATMREELLEAKRQMGLDQLTQIYNRGAFDRAMKQYINISALSAQPLMVMMVDLDHFKSINDQFGHQAGDKVLIEAARNIVCTFPRKSDFVARYGGEEFAAILFDVSPQDGAKLAERLLKRMRKLIVEHDGAEIQVTCSVGYSFLGSNDTVETLIQRADKALYRAKEDGRDRAVEV